MSENKPNGFLKNMCKIGTPECAIFFAVVTMILAILFLSFGFWNTVLVLLIMGLGAFLGGVKDKKGWLKKLINRLVPDRKMVPYREQNPEIIRTVREATAAADKREEEPATREEEPAAQEAEAAPQEEKTSDQE